MSQPETKTSSLFEAFAEVPDPRSASGRRYSLESILTLTTVAMLAGARSLYAIAQFGRDRKGRVFAKALGFKKDNTPSCTTLHYLFAVLDTKAFESCISEWAKGRRKSGWEEISIDGKTLRGSQGHQVPGVHLLAAFSHEAKEVITQVPVDAKTNEHKAALELMELIPLKGVVVTGDAMFCQRDLSKKIKKKGGDYLWTVKENQPSLLESIKSAFDESDFSPSGKYKGSQ